MFGVWLIIISKLYTIIYYLVFDAEHRTIHYPILLPLYTLHWVFYIL